MPHPFQQSAPDDRHPWSYWVRRSGDEGGRWLERYGRHRAVAELCDRALGLLRAREAGPGMALLATAGERLRDAPMEPSIRHVMNRWYFGTLAYGCYAEGDHDRADRCMAAAHDAVAAAVGECPFLLALAHHAQEFRLHRARIARNRCRWAQMHAHVAHARAMTLGTVELCRLPTGGEVWIHTLRDFYARIPDITADELRSVRGIVDDALRMRLFDEFVQGLYRLPGFVIHPPAEPEGAAARDVPPAPAHPVAAAV
ncbi:MAG TPA: hypothetical protein VFJ82_04380 [Longimicrobium sp.]|nr:hypothetical protein [Longimicrobium sp.]